MRDSVPLPLLGLQLMDRLKAELRGSHRGHRGFTENSEKPITTQNQELDLKLRNDGFDSYNN